MLIQGMILESLRYGDVLKVRKEGSDFITISPSGEEQGLKSLRGEVNLKKVKAD